MASIRERDPELWLRTKLDQPWSSGNLTPMLDAPTLTQVIELFDGLEVIVRLRLVMALVGLLVRKSVGTLDADMVALVGKLLAKAADDKDEWVRASARLLRAVQEDDLVAAMQGTDFALAVEELSAQARGLESPAFLPRELQYVTLVDRKPLQPVPGIASSYHVNEAERSAMFEQLARAGSEALMSSVRSDSASMAPGARRRPTSFLVESSRLPRLPSAPVPGGNSTASLNAWSAGRPAFGAPAGVPTGGLREGKMAIMDAGEAMMLIKAREDALKRKRDEEQQAVEERARKRRERMEQKVERDKQRAAAAAAKEAAAKEAAAKQAAAKEAAAKEAAAKEAAHASAAEGDVPPSARPAEPSAPSQRSAEEVEATLQKLTSEAPSLSPSETEQIRQFLLGNYPRDEQARQIVLSQSSVFDAVRQKTAVTAIVFEMNHGTGHWRKLKRTRYTKGD